MTLSLFTCATLLFAIATPASVQGAPLRGLGLIALESSAAQRDVSHVTPGSNVLLDSPDNDGGGSVGTNALHGESAASRDADSAMTPDALPPHAITPIDPALPVASPKHPRYRWQALVPGALK
jgi:hypothetical protein